MSPHDKQVLPECATIAIGTLPHTDPSAAVDFMLRHHPDCPSWPQLPQADFREGMYIQYAEGMPAAVVDVPGRRIYFDSEAAPQAMADFYGRYLEGEVDFCAISPDYSRGFGLLLERLPVPGARFVKGQVTGPASFGLTVTDENSKPILYHADLYEAITRTLALKGRWQVEQYRRAAPEAQPIIFYDEPYLTQVGSALISLTPEQVVASLNECFEAIDGYTGIHVCGGTDWGLLTTTTVDILHFDAIAHSREFLIYDKELAAFLERGGMIAWGIVPTDESAWERDAGALAEEVLRQVEVVAGFSGSATDAPEILRHSFISQACGTGTLEASLAERCFELAGEVSGVLRGQI
ncbi:MAG: uroporphyrinogen decarboxylase/cobalamine-independent methonine synthase family protein [Thermoleophilia bacterium]